MPRGKHQVFHAPRFCYFCPAARVELSGIELLRELRVFLHGNLLVPLHPSVMTGHGINSPVDEHPEERVAQLGSFLDGLQLLAAGLDRHALGRRGIGGSGRVRLQQSDRKDE